MSKKIAGAFICAASVISASCVLADEVSLLDEAPVAMENSGPESLLADSARESADNTNTESTATQNPSSTQEQLKPDAGEGITDASLEALMNVEVTSVSRKAELFSDVPAALTVITQEDIRRSGFSTLPEVLRLVPGLHVGRIGSHKWSISARGFSGEFANKLLVLIDGRTIYNPAFSGVYWESQGLLLEDIERIEIIRGPGASVWGANAVNGVINITTKSAKDTQGTLLLGRLGSHEKIGGFRYGTKIGEKAYGRFYVKTSHHDESVTPDGSSGLDAWKQTRAGFRLDWEKSDKDTLTLQGDITDDSLNEVFTRLSLAPPAVTLERGKLTYKELNLLGRWTRILGKDSDMSLQMYFDKSARTSNVIQTKTEQADIDFNHRFRLNPRHEIVWGLGYRRSKVDFKNSFELSVNTPKKNTNLYSAFVQDDITLKEDKLRLILGAKLEKNSFTGFEFQPSARMVWTPDSKQTFWGAISRAVRTPAHTDLGLNSNLTVIPTPGFPVLVSVFGDPNVSSEKLLAHEIGYRVQPNSNFILDMTAFYNRYSDLITLENRTPYFQPGPLPPHIVAPIYYVNNAKGSTYGIEISPTWKVSRRWKLSGNYSYFKANLTSTTTTAPEEERQYPSHMVQLRSSHDLSRNLSLDVFASYTSKSEVDRTIPGFSRVDLRFGWKPSEDLDLSFGVQNLTSSQHKESQSFLGISREIPRSVYVQGSWKF